MSLTLDAAPQFVRDSTTNEIVGIKDSNDGEVRYLPFNAIQGAVTSAAALPTAGSGYAGVMYYVAGGAGVADTVSVCLKGTDDNWDWIEVAAGQTV